MHFKIKDIGSVITGITPLTNINKYYTDKLYPFIGPTDIKNVKYVYATKKGVSKAAFHDYQSKFIDINSIMVDCIGSDLGNVALTTTKSLTNQQINSITKIKSNIVNYQYLYYLLNMKKEYFQRLGDSGSTVPIVNKSLFENIVINILPLAQQLRITNILCY